MVKGRLPVDIRAGGEMNDVKCDRRLRRKRVGRRQRVFIDEGPRPQPRTDRLRLRTDQHGCEAQEMG